jgi:hypothetical protein
MKTHLTYFFSFFLGMWLSVTGQEIWTPCSNLPVQTSLLCVTYAKGMFVAGGANGTMITSTDGVLWTAQFSGTKNAINSITYGNDLFMAVGDSGTILVSGDGGIWIDRSLQDSVKNQVNIPAVTYGAGRFVMSAYWPYASIDGIEWTPKLTLITSMTLFALHYGKGQFIAAGSKYYVFTSLNGTDWTHRSGWEGLDPLFYRTYRGIASSDSLFVLIWDNFNSFFSGGGIETSDDCITFTSRKSGMPLLLGVTYGNGYFVAVGDSGRIYSSPDGLAWAQNESGTKAPLSGVAVGNNTFVAVGGSGTILHSPALLPVRWSSGTVRHYVGTIVISGRTCRYTLGSAGRIVAKIFTLNGNVAATLVDKMLTPGTYSFSIPSVFSAGTYVLSVGSGSSVIISKISLLN